MNTILENAKNSIQIGVEDFKKAEEGDARRIVAAVRNIYSGMLLLFKKKLIDLSPEYDKELLIKEKIIFKKNKNGIILPKGTGKKTVDYQSINTRLDDLDIDINWKIMEQIQKVRNDLEHYCTSLSNTAILKIISDTFIILDSFIRTHLKEHPKTLLGEETWVFIIEHAETYKRFKEEWQKIYKQLSFSNRIVGDNIGHACCPSCNCDIFLLLEGEEGKSNPTLVCRACNSDVEHKEYVPTIIEYLTPIRDKDDDGQDSFYPCPSCGDDAYLYSEDICLSCDEENLSQCSECGSRIETYMIGNLDNLCGTCDHMRYLMGKND